MSHFLGTAKLFKRDFVLYLPFSHIWGFQLFYLLINLKWSVFNFSHSNMYIILSHCISNFHFPNSKEHHPLEYLSSIFLLRLSIFSNLWPIFKKSVFSFFILLSLTHLKNQFFPFLFLSLTGDIHEHEMSLHFLVSTLIFLSSVLYFSVYKSFALVKLIFK